MANLKFTFIVLLIFGCVAAQTGKSVVTVPTDPVTFSVGEDVILPCEVKPPFNLTKKTVEWKYFDKSTDKKLQVHVFRNEKDDPDSQDEKFKSRTSLFPDEMTRGNLSLKLRSAIKTDEGIYTCVVNKLDNSDREGDIQLIVYTKDQAQQKNKSGSVSDPDSRLGLVLTSLVIIAVILQAWCCIM